MKYKSRYEELFAACIIQPQCQLRNKRFIREELWGNIFMDISPQYSKRRVDYWFPNINLIVEIDGEQHEKSMHSQRENGVQMWKAQISRDELLVNLCEENDIPILHISHRDFNQFDDDEIDKMVALINKKLILIL